MKRRNLLTMIALAGFASVQAQTILIEDFETGNTGAALQPVAAGAGWETVNGYNGTNASYNWHNYYSNPEGAAGSTIGGACCASCSGPINMDPVDGSGPREEILLSPELTLDNTYQLQFTWRVSPMNVNENSRYDLQVRVVTDGNLASAETVFSIQNEQMLRESGVTVFPITTWDQHTSKVDLSDWQGENVRLAFVYKMYALSANVVWLDDISVSQHTPSAGPVASVTLDRYDFKEVYLGEKRYSDVITLTNTGKDGLKITGTDFPEGIGINIDTESVNLRTYENVDFQLTYTASMTSKASGEAVLHTTGGDVVIAFSASKQLLPDGSSLENFESYFPPAGWKNNGWAWTTAAIEGDHSAYSGGDFSATYLRSPRLDLSEGGQLSFTYYNQYEDEYAPEYDIELQLSTDGGDNWKTLWVSDYQNGLNQLLTETIDLGFGTDESYVRWYYPAVEMDDEGVYDHSYFTLDRVILPHVYGADGVPGKATLVSPAQGAENVYPRDIVLEWAPAQFATGYKLYVGTNPEANNFIEDLNVGNVLTYTIAARLDYETTYYWKVVGYNDKGEATGVATWRFTTQPDASVVTFPWEENFDNCTNEVPNGWLSTTTITDLEPTWTNRCWEPLRTDKAYGGKGASLYTMWLSSGYSSTVTSPEFTLPADGEGMSISFVWGDNHPVALIIDETGLLKKQNVEGGNGYSDVVFEVLSDGEWKQEAYLSENYNDDGDTKYWRNETVDLTAYAGKTIQFRWINHAYTGSHRGAALDNIVINGNVADRVEFNKTGWAAGIVNYEKATNSGEQFTLLNRGKVAQTVRSVTFGTENFASSIAAGQVIAPEEGLPFSVTFFAKDSEAEVSDEMTVEFESGLTASFPVSGQGLPADVLYYGFEANDLDYQWKDDFTMFDVDNKVNVSLGYYLTVVENDGSKYAFTQVENNNLNMLTAHSGNHTIAAAAPADNSSAEDWLVSKQLIVGADASFDFYVRNLGTVNTVFVGDNDLHRVAVLVSTTTGEKTSNFTTVMRETEVPYLNENQWQHYVVDLSAYEGQEIYVAVRHTTISASWMAFFDDFTFTHVGDAQNPTGIGSVQNLSTGEVTVWNMDGTQVAAGKTDKVVSSLPKGLYIIKTAEGKVEKIRK